jgi:hypothetical protein
LQAAEQIKKAMCAAQRLLYEAIPNGISGANPFAAQTCLQAAEQIKKAMCAAQRLLYEAIPNGISGANPFAAQNCF